MENNSSNKWKTEINDIGNRVGKSQAALLSCLQAVQKVEGYIIPESIEYISKELNVPPMRVYSVITFYAQFRLNPVGRNIVTICRGTACHVRGSGRILKEGEKALNLRAGETDEKLLFTIDRVACFGSCALSPVVVVEDRDSGARKVYGKMTAPRLMEIIDQLKKESEDEAIGEDMASDVDVASALGDDAA
ncbi:MAG: NAD(P)H-dependent oxidoreductase subunit E [Thermoplasmata archaeon]|nr:NAD(P)H-dependent oxidoreductase subunit E [Thermoplasmata archaeon]